MTLNLNINLIQQKAIDKFCTLKVGALFVKPGSGKTKVAVELLKLKENHYDTVVWIAPASLFQDKEFSKSWEVE